MQDIRARCIESYGRLKKLRLVGEEVGIPWQTVYVHLRAAGVAVTGDKSRYGSDRDRLAAHAEHEFQRLVPNAQNQNTTQFQPKIDFLAGAFGVDVKASLPHLGHVRAKYKRWAFSMKKQERHADFIACFGYHDLEQYELFLLPGEAIRKYMSVSIPVNRTSKWRDYAINPIELHRFFIDLQRAIAA